MVLSCEQEFITLTPLVWITIHDSMEEHENMNQHVFEHGVGG